jgi:hypothetical protein
VGGVGSARRAVCIVTNVTRSGVSAGATSGIEGRPSGLNDHFDPVSVDKEDVNSCLLVFWERLP